MEGSEGRVKESNGRIGEGLQETTPTVRGGTGTAAAFV